MLYLPQPNLATALPQADRDDDPGGGAAVHAVCFDQHRMAIFLCRRTERMSRGVGAAVHAVCSG